MGRAAAASTRSTIGQWEHDAVMAVNLKYARGFANKVFGEFKTVVDTRTSCGYSRLPWLLEHPCQEGLTMRTVQITLDEQLLKEVDAQVRSARTTRSAFARKALRAAIVRLKEIALETKHRKGYRDKPVGPKEFKVWETEQAWGDE